MATDKVKTSETSRMRVPSGMPRPGSRKPFKAAQIKQFLQDVMIELKRCEWPNRDQVTRSTLIVLGFVVLFSAYIGGLDALLSFVARSAGLFGGR